MARVSKALHSYGTWKIKESAFGETIDIHVLQSDLFQMRGA